MLIITRNSVKSVDGSHPQFYIDKENLALLIKAPYRNSVLDSLGQDGVIVDVVSIDGDKIFINESELKTEHNLVEGIDCCVQVELP